MNKVEIHMKPNIRYMGQAGTELTSQIPSSGKYILNKSLTGCGGTELFIRSGMALVLISPRSGVLKNKSQQHPECLLFRSSSNEDLSNLKANLRKYLDSCQATPFSQRQPPKILVTLDSAKYVIEELEYRGWIDRFTFLVDEFQCLIGDASFKGQTEIEFLCMLDSKAKNICYMSATPIEEQYLELLPEFKNLTMYKLIWDPSVIIEPTIQEIQMKRGESTISIVSKIIADFRQNGYFARKIVNGQEMQSAEVVIFVNEVKTIVDIIKKNSLPPSETTILVSESNKYVSELIKAGYTINDQCTESNNPKNKPYTFCSKASFEGRDFYSDNACTYIFIDGSKDWEILDTAIEIPQILGRQRLQDNVFRDYATIYFRTKPTQMSDAEFKERMNLKLEESKNLLREYDKGGDFTKQLLTNLIRNQDKNNRYANYYVDVIDKGNEGFEPVLNTLVVLSDYNLNVLRQYYYANPYQLISAIRSELGGRYGTKPQELRNFEYAFYKAQTFSEKMRLYTEFRECHPNDEFYPEVLFMNPYIDFDYHVFYNRLGATVLKSEEYNEKSIRQAYRQSFYRAQIISKCQQQFEIGRNYTADEVKSRLQWIYDQVELGQTATAIQITSYADVTISKPTIQGKRQQAYQITSYKQ